MAINIIRAWKDPEYRKTLTAEELASLPENPAGSANLSDEELASVAGGLPVQHTFVMTGFPDGPCGNASNQCGPAAP
jgi:mersacidin/lichenicidin family type 2 lantibiotic